LVDVLRIVIAEPVSPRNGVHQRQIPIDDCIPGLTVAPSSGRDQLRDLAAVRHASLLPVEGAQRVPQGRKWVFLEEDAVPLKIPASTPAVS
jgi:hypothetical protein